MASLNYTRHEKIWLKNHPSFNEKWVQNIIAEDPSIIGLGDLYLRDIEKIQPKAGRLDLLLEDSEGEKRYEVELQLGKSDESHIIRTIEYWDIERKRYPQYDHCAVIIAEDITSRFLNVLSLFNGHIPLIAIQMNAVRINDNIALIFNKVLDEVELGIEDDTSDIPITDRNYWDSKSPYSIKIVDKIFEILTSFSDKLSLKYNKGFVTLMENDITNAFVRLYPRRKFLQMNIKYPLQEEIVNKLEYSELNFIKYNKSGRYRIDLKEDDIGKNKDLLKWFLKLAYDYSKK